MFVNVLTGKGQPEISLGRTDTTITVRVD